MENDNELLNKNLDKETEQNTAFTTAEDSPLGSKIVPTVKPQKEIGLDIDGKFFDNIINAGEASVLDISKPHAQIRHPRTDEQG